MYTLLLADDEPLVLESMKKIIHGGFSNVQKFIVAKTGREAVRLAMQHSPDIVIMDIRMPGISGLDAIRVIKKWRADIVFVVISAYEYFDYAHEALKLGVTDYLLKPVGKEEILDVIGRAMEKSAETREKTDRELKYLEDRKQIAALLESQFLISAIMGAPAAEIEVYAKLLDLAPSDGRVIVLESLETQPAAWQKTETILDVIRRQAKSLFPGCVAASTRASRLVLFMPLAGDSPAGPLELQSKLLRDTPFDKIRMGIGDPYFGYSGIAASYNEAISRLQKHPGDPDKDGKEYPYEREKELMDALQRGDGVKALDAAHQLTEWFRVQDMDFEQVKRRLSRIIALLLEIGDRFAGAEAYDSFFELNDYLSVAKWLESHVKRIVEHMAAERESRMGDTFHRAKEYIGGHYHLDIGLESVAKHINMSAAYFSSLFHKNEGMSFVNYLTGVRVEKAKELIYQRKFSVKEISRMVGYHNPNYFSRVFKRATGMSPTALLETLSDNRSFKS